MVNTARATLASDLSAVAKAKLDLSYCTIPAPISGTHRKPAGAPGNLVKENDVALVVIHQVEPIFVSFGVPEDHLAAIRRLNAAIRCPYTSPCRTAPTAPPPDRSRSSTTPWTQPPAPST